MDRPAWWDICQKCGADLDWTWTKTPSGPVFFEVLGQRCILCRQCAAIAWDMERMNRMVNGE